MSIQGYQDLRVWQAAMELAVGVHDVTKPLPKDDRVDHANQLRRAAFSVPAKIAHGHGRQDLRAYIHNLGIARSALAEVTTGLELLRRLSYVPGERTQVLLEQASSLERQLQSLSDALMIRLGEDALSYDPDDL
jgi:four helix bundle protein